MVVERLFLCWNHTYVTNICLLWQMDKSLPYIQLWQGYHRVVLGHCFCSICVVISSSQTKLIITYSSNSTSNFTSNSTTMNKNVSIYNNNIVECSGTFTL